MFREYLSTPEEAFAASVEGAAYASQMNRIFLEHRVRPVSWVPTIPRVRTEPHIIRILRPMQELRRYMEARGWTASEYVTAVSAAREIDGPRSMAWF